MPDAATAHAFGIALHADFEAPGLPPGAPPEPLPGTEVRIVPREELDAIWKPASPERLLEEEFGGKAPARTVDSDTEIGYRLYARHFGLALIAPDGSRVLCAPPGVAAWRWQRFLVGRVLPWAALLRGRELLHASAVRIGDSAVAFVAPTGGGKTSLATRLVLRGAGFVTDDVLAIDREDGIRVHPGACLVAVRPAERERIERGDWRRLGRVLGSSGKTYVQIEREDAPLPLSALYFLAPRPGAATLIESGGVNARMLLGSTFVASVATPQRLAGLLDLCAEVAADVPLFRAWVDPAGGSDELATAIWEHVGAGAVA